MRWLRRQATRPRHAQLRAIARGARVGRRPHPTGGLPLSGESVKLSHARPQAPRPPQVTVPTSWETTSSRKNLPCVFHRNHRGRPCRAGTAVGAQAESAAWRYHTRRSRGETGKMGTASPTLARKRARCPARARSVPCVCVRVCVCSVCMCIIHICILCIYALRTLHLGQCQSPSPAPRTFPHSLPTFLCAALRVAARVWC